MTKLEIYINFFTNIRQKPNKVGIASNNDYKFDVVDSNNTTVTYIPLCVYYDTRNDNNVGILLSKQVGDSTPTRMLYSTNVEPDGDVTFSNANNTFESSDPEIIRNFDMMLHRFFDAVAATLPKPV